MHISSDYIFLMVRSYEQHLGACLGAILVLLSLRFTPKFEGSTEAKVICTLMWSLKMAILCILSATIMMSLIVVPNSQYKSLRDRKTPPIKSKL